MILKNNTRLVNRIVDPKYDTPELIKARLKGSEAPAFPFLTYLGATNNTEFGEVANNVEISNFTQFSKIFTGQDVVLAVWEKSTTVELINDTDTFLTKKYEPGIALSFHFDANTLTTTFGPYKGDTTFVKQEASITITAYTEKQIIKLGDLYKFWYLPETDTNALFTILQATNFSNNEGEFVYSEIIFETVNDKIATTGQAIDQFIQLAPPGEGYAWPNWDKNTNTWSVDEQRAFNTPIDEIQIELFGASIFVAPTIFGRRLNGPGDKTVEAPHILVPFEMRAPIGSDTSKSIAGENNFYFIPEAFINVEAFYTDWKDNIRDNYDLTATRKYEGYISTNYDVVRATNATTPKQNIFDPSLTYNVAPDGIDAPLKINTNAIPYFEYIEGVDFELIGKYSIPQILMYNSLLYIDTVKLPISLTETTIITAKSIPLVGGFLNILTVGVPVAWDRSTSVIPAKPISGFIPATLYDFGGVGTNVGGDNGNLPLDLFRNETDDSPAGLLGLNNITTAIRFGLTDKIAVPDPYTGGVKILDTIDLAQQGDKGWKFKGGTTKELPINPNLKLNEGFAIDYIGFQGVAKCDYKIVAFRDGQPLFQLYQQTRGKYTTSVREWTNSIKTSNYNEINNKTIDYPKEIVLPRPSDVYGNLTINVHKTFDTGLNSPEDISRHSNEVFIYLQDYNTTWNLLKKDYNTISIQLNEVLAYFEELYNHSYPNRTIELPFNLFENNRYNFLTDRGQGTGKIKVWYSPTILGICFGDYCHTTQTKEYAIAYFIEVFKEQNIIKITAEVYPSTTYWCSASDKKCNKEYTVNQAQYKQTFWDIIFKRIDK